MVLLGQVVRALGAVVLSALIGLVAFAVGIFVLVEILAGTRQGAGFVIAGLFFIVAIVGLVSLVLVAKLTVVFYRKFGGTSKQAE